MYRPNGVQVTPTSDLNEWRRQHKIAKRRNSERLRRALIRQGEEGRYAVVLADPPWDTKGGQSPGHCGQQRHYPTATLDSIQSMDVSCIAEDAVLFLWTMASMIPEALSVMQAWRFTYKTEIVWVKNHHGTGGFLLMQHEPVLVGIRGRFRADLRVAKNISSVIHAPRTVHSRKPPALHEAIERMFPDLPKIEFFARAPRLGWTVWGDEAQGQADPDALPAAPYQQELLSCE